MTALDGRREDCMVGQLFYTLHLKTVTVKKKPDISVCPQYRFAKTSKMFQNDDK